MSRLHRRPSESRATSEVLKVLLVEDAEWDAELVLQQLKRAGLSCESRRVQTEPELRRSLLEFQPHIVLSDFAMPGFNGMDALRICRESDAEIPLIFVSGTVGEDIAVEAMKAGAADYVMKTNLGRLGPAVRREVREAQLRQGRWIAEMALRRAQTMAKLAHVITGPDGSFESWSETLPELIGVDAARMPQSTREWLDILHVDDRAKFREKSIEAATTGRRLDLEYRLRRADGAWIDVRQAIEPMQGERDAEGRVRWFNTLQDVTEEKQAEVELRKSESLKGAILESSLDCLITIDHEGKVVEFNPAAEATFCFKRTDALGKAVADLIIPPRYRDAHRRGLARYLATGEGPVLGKRLELEALRADGTEFPVELAISPTKSGPMPLFTAFVRDITERKKAEEKIKRLNRVYAVLSGINSLIVRVQNREELYRGACRIAVEAGQFPKAWIGEVEPDSKSVSLIASHGADAPFFERLAAALRADTGQGGIVAQAVRERRAVISNDIEHDPGVLGRDVAVATGSRAIAVLPLTVGNGIAGVLVLHAEATGFFDDDEMKLLLELAGDISFALDHIEQEERVKRLTRVHAVLTGINAAIVRIRDRQELFREACRIAVEAGQLRLAWIGIVNPKKEEIVPAGFSGPEQGLLGVIRLSTREDSSRFGMAGRAIRDGVSAVSNDVLADKGSRVRGESARRGFRSLAMIPLIVDGAAFGVLGLHAAEAGFFDQDEMKLLTEVAGNLAFALEHIAKEEKVRRLTRVQAVLSGINAAIVRIRDREALFQEACRIAVEAGEFCLAAVSLIDPQTHEVRAAAWAGEEAEYFANMRYYAGSDAPPGGSPGVDVIQVQRPWICNDIETEGSRLIYLKECIARGYRSIAMLPLVIEGRSAGLLALYARELGFFDEAEMKLLVELAGDISFALEHIENAEKLDYVAYYDELTGLANRTLFHERLSRHVSAASLGKSRVAVVLVDIERFKTINDTLGRQAGDALLKQVAERMTRYSADPARLARIGADHFAVVVSEVQSEDEFARRTETRMQEFFGEPFRLGDSELRISAKAGIAMFPNDGTDSETLFRNAEAALKKAKASGERYLFYTRGMTERVAEKLTLENKLRQALEKEEFVLHYQPKVELENRQIVGVEALIRWQSRELGLVPPMKFIPLMEETGLILQVGAWALRRAALDHKAWVEAGLKAPRVAVNVSPIQLRQRDFVRVVEQAIMEGIAPTGIDLEITESLIMEDIHTNIEKLILIRKLGVAVAIDDFGTGYSSLSYLARLPVETLKIDRSFVITMLEDPNTATLVQTMISLAHSFRLKVVAEGVDSEDQAKMLRLLRCDQMQGYLFSKPVPNDALVALLRKSS
jgi:diguanylate cyclase (GGDEF)-like protein/PAS domain S-box-containing protein